MQGMTCRAWVRKMVSEWAFDYFPGFCYGIGLQVNVCISRKGYILIKGF